MRGYPITQYEIDYISANFMDKTDEEMATHLKRPKCTVAFLRSKNGFLRVNKSKIFTEYEQDFVLNNFDKLSDEQIGLHLNRSTYCIKMYRKRNAIERINNKKQEYISKTVQEMRELIAYCETSTSPYKIDKAKEKLKKLSGL